MKTITVSRVSTEEQKDAGNSLPAQEVRLQNYSARKSLQIIKSYSFDESAYKNKRIVFDELLAEVKEQSEKEKIALCFDKVDRFSRNIFDKRVSELYGLAISGKIELHFVSENLIINDKISASEKFSFGINLGLAKYYSDAISDNTRKALETKREKGEWLGRAPLGYKNVENANGTKTIIIDKEKEHLIRKMFEMYATGQHSFHSIREAIHREGLRTFNDLKISLSGVENILRDPFYYGQPYSKKYGMYKQEHNYGRIIKKELFDQCTEIRLGRKKGIYKSVTREFTFKGILKCTNCGCMITPEFHRKKSGLEFTHYSCTNGKGICKRHYVSEGELLEQIHNELLKFSKVSIRAQERLVIALNKSNKEDEAYNKKQLIRITTELTRLAQKKENLLDAFIDPENKSITKSDYDKKLQNILDNQLALNQELNRYSKKERNYKTTINTIFSLARRALEIFQSSEPKEKRQFLAYLLQNPTLYEKKLDYSMRSPFNLIIDLGNQPIRGDYRVSIPN